MGCYKLGHQKPKQTENYAGTEVQLTNSENSKEISEDPPIYNALDNLRIYEEPSQKRFPRITSAHPEDVLIGKKDDPIRTRSSLRNNEESLFGLVSLIEQTSIDEALQDNDFIIAMQEELNQFTSNGRIGFNIIGTKWVFRNKLNEQGEFVRNKARLVARGYSQQEGIDYNETFSPVVRLESIRLLISFIVQNNITLYQMDVKSAFLNAYIEEEVYVRL